MPRDYRVYLDDILRAAAKIRGQTEDLSREAFLEDPKTVDAVIRHLEIIGEAAKQIPRVVRTRCPDVEWERLAGSGTSCSSPCPWPPPNRPGEYRYPSGAGSVRLLDPF